MADKEGNFFLVIEGLDGSGKTEIVRRLSGILAQTVKDRLLLTYEPHDPSCAGLYIRQVLSKKIPLAETTLALAFAVNRADHNDREIKPFLETGSQKVVLCDRYYLSSLVYQSSELTPDEIMLINKHAKQPDLTIYLDASIQTCYRRMRTRPEDKELFEKNLALTQTKYKQAIEFLRQRGERIQEVDANPEIHDVITNVLNTINQFVPQWLKLNPSFDALLPHDPDVFTLNGQIQGYETQKLEEFTERIPSFWKSGRISGKEDLEHTLQQIKASIANEIDQMPLNDLGWLLIGYLKRDGYTLGNMLPWTDICAYELSYTLPLRVQQQGTLVILSEAQGSDKIRQKVQEIMQLSNFMIVLDPKRYSHTDYYERALVQYAHDSHNQHGWVDALRKLIEENKTLSKQLNIRVIEDKIYESLSPSTHVIKRAEIAKFVLADAVQRFYEEYHQTFRGIPGIQQTLLDFNQNEGIEPKPKND